MKTASTPAATPAAASVGMNLGLSCADAVASAGKLETVGDVEDDGDVEGAEDGERAHIDDQVVIAERRTPFGDHDSGRADRGQLADDVPHVLWRQELSLLDVDHAPGRRGGHEQIGLTREERRDLDDVDHLRHRLGLRWLVDVREDRESGRAA